MKSLLVIIFTNTYLFSAEINIQVSPDSIFVGMLSSINISVNNLKDGEYPVFYKIADNHVLYSVVDRTLEKLSVEIILQFWEAKKVSIPPIIIEIRKSKKVLYSLLDKKNNNNL